MAVHRINDLLALGSSRKCAAALKLLRMSVHCSAVQWKKDEADLTLKVADNIMAAGNRYLRDDTEVLRENLKKRKSDLAVNFDHMVEFVLLTTLFHTRLFL